MKNPTYLETVARNHARNAELSARREREALRALRTCELTPAEARSLVMAGAEPVAVGSSDTEIQSLLLTE